MYVTIAIYEDWTAVSQLLTAEAWHRGYRWVSCFADTLPQDRLEDVAWELGVDVLPLWLKLWEEAAQTGTLERCGRDLLVRHLCYHLRAHDGDDCDIRARLSSAFRSWKGSLPRNYQSREEGIRPAIMQHNLPPHWCPQNSRDAILVEAFARHWPKESPRLRYRMLHGDDHITIEPDGRWPSGQTLIVYPTPLVGCEDLPAHAALSTSPLPSHAATWAADGSDVHKPWGN